MRCMTEAGYLHTMSEGGRVPARSLREVGSCMRYFLLLEHQHQAGGDGGAAAWGGRQRYLGEAGGGGTAGRAAGAAGRHVAHAPQADRVEVERRAAAVGAAGCAQLLQLQRRLQYRRFPGHTARAAQPLDQAGQLNILQQHTRAQLLTHSPCSTHEHKPPTHQVRSTCGHSPQQRARHGPQLTCRPTQAGTAPH